MLFIQEWGERNGFPMGCSVRPVQTRDPEETAILTVWTLSEGFSLFNNQSRATDGVKACVFEQPDNWQELEAKGEPVERTPLAAVTYNKTGAHMVRPPKLIF